MGQFGTSATRAYGVLIALVFILLFMALFFVVSDKVYFTGLASDDPDSLGGIGSTGSPTSTEPIGVSSSDPGKGSITHISGDTRNQVTYSNPKVSVKISEDSDVNSNNPVNVREPQQGSAVSGVGVRWSTQIGVPSGVSTLNELEITLPSEAKYVQVDGPNARASVQTRNAPIGFFNFYKAILAQPEEEIAVKILDPSAGQYEVSFSTPSVTATERLLSSGNKQVTVSNPGSTSYTAVSIVTTLSGVTEPAGIKVVSSTGEDLSLVYAYNEDKREMLINFNVDINKDSKQVFTVIVPDTSVSSEPSEPAEPFTFDDLSDECKGTYSCEAVSPCTRSDDATDILAGSDIVGGIISSVCTTVTDNCPPTISKIEDCSLNEPIHTTSEDKLGETEVGVYSDGDRVASVVVSTDEESVDINFAPETEYGLQQDESCRNAVLDEGEEDVDCGGICKSCAKDKLNVKAFFLWLVVAGLVVMIIVLQRKASSLKAALSKI